jgi:hypothetical protein
MKKLFAHEIVLNRSILLIDCKNNIKFILSRKRPDMAVDGESHWMLLSGEDLICSDPFRISLFQELNKRGYKVENKFDSKISYKETH